MKGKALKEKRSQVYNTVHDLREKIRKEERDFTEEERAAFTEACNDFDKLTVQIQEAEAEERITQTMGQMPGREDTTGQQTAKPSYRDALNGWARSNSSFGDVEVSEREAQAMKHYGLNGGRDLRIDLGQPIQSKEQRVMNVATDTEGAEYVPEEFRRVLEIALLEFGEFRNECTIMRTASGGAMPMPTMNDTGNTGAQINENTDNSGDEAMPTTGEVILNAYKYTSNPVLITQELLEDSAFDMASVIGQQLGIRLARIQNTKITTGTGSSTPKGVMVAATVGRTATNATSITYEDLLELKYSVGSAYRRRGAKFMFNDNLMVKLRLIQDGAGSYVLTPNLADAAGGLLLGHPIVFNEDVEASLAATNLVMAFGDLSKYMIREVRSVRFYRLQERYRLEKDADAFVAYMRFDGDLLDAGTNPIKTLKMAAGS